MRRDVFHAIADPTRRKIIDTLVQKPLTPNSVATNFHISRPAVSKHIKILNECGLVQIKQQGRDRICEARLEKLNEISEWIEQYRRFWETKLDNLEKHLSEEDES